jgi:signal transduction histidine kinase
VDVADSGAGVPVELREVIFEPLVRADTTVEGLGLGLAACRRIAANHHAQVSVDDSHFGGAVFRVVATPDPRRGVSAVAAAPGSTPTA